MPNYIEGLDNVLIPPPTTSTEIPEGTYNWEIYETIPHSIQQRVEQPMTPNDATPSPTNVGRSRRGGMRPESRIVHTSVDIPKKKRDEFSEIERICKYPYKDKQIEF